MPAVNPGAANLIAWWSLADTLADSHTGGYTLTGTGSPSYTDGNGGARAIVFNGTTQYASRSTSGWSFSGSASFVAWVKLDAATPATDPLTGCWALGSGAGGNSHYPYTNSLLYQDVFRTTRVNAVTPAAVTRSNWHMVTVTTNGTTWRFYQNTTEATNTAAQASVTVPSTMYLGASITPASFKMQGQMQRVAVFSSALSTDEIDWLYNSGSGRSYSDLLATGQPAAIRSVFVPGMMSGGRTIIRPGWGG